MTTTTKDGQVQANLELQLGHPAEARPGAPSEVQQRLSTGKSSAPPPCQPGAARRPRHRGPAARAKNRARAALHQAAKAAAALARVGASPSPLAEGVSPSTPEAPLSSISTPASVLTSASVSTPSSVSTPATVSTPAPVSTSASVLTSQELQNRTLKEVGTIMCYVCDFDMCFPHLDSVDISCKCSVGEDSR